tara:strand:+ start:1906 stop:2268 length:363 start_codon:yes stop_codon:yes gene_type:complete
MAFVCGMLFNVFWGYLLGLGYGITLFRNTAVDCLMIMAKNVQTIYEVQELKYMAFAMMDRDAKYIEFQKLVDKNEIKSVENTLIRNYINSIPPRFNNFVEFHDWDSAMKYLNGVYNKEKL